MAVTPALRRIVPQAVPLLMAGLFAACGDSQEDPSPASPPPVVAALEAPAAVAAGATELLARLYRSVALGPALTTNDFSLDVAHLREQLWPDLAVAGAEPAAGTHVRASNVAGTVAAQLLADPGAREGLRKDDPFGLALHDAWVAQAAGGPERYKAWCADEAQGLFKRRAEELQGLFERPIR